MSTIHDQEAREIIRHQLDQSLLVEAAAGTGKTYELVERLTQVLQEGLTTIDRVVVLTFTHKAAGELKLRIRQSLEERREKVDGEAQNYLTAAIAHLEEARIGTIHSFCIELLKERPVAAGVDPDFQLLEDEGAERLFDAAYELWSQQRLAVRPKTLLRAIAHQSLRNSPLSPHQALRDAARSLREWRDHPQSWHQPDFELEARCDEVLGEIEYFQTHHAEAFRKSHRLAKKLLEPLKNYLSWQERTQAFQKKTNYPELEAQLRKLHQDIERKLSYEPDLRLSEAYQELYLRLETFSKDSEQHLASTLHRELATVIEAYQQQKLTLGYLDFSDLLYKARDLLRDDLSVRVYLQDRFSHLFVDEFQDTDPVQVELLMYLGAESSDEKDWTRLKPKPGKLFIVGDPKQSIYGFRRADIDLYHRVKQHLQEGGVRYVQLSHSFRANRALQGAINAAFSPHMRPENEAQAPYIALEGGPEAQAEQPSLVALPAAYSVNNQGRTNYKSIEKSLPATIAGYIDWLLNSSNYRVRESARSEPVPIQAQHICILFRSFRRFQGDLSADYTQALTHLGIKHVLLGAACLYAREEVEAVKAALHALEWPAEEIYLYATLRGPLFAISDELLYSYRKAHGKLNCFRIPEEATEDHQSICDALRTISELSRVRNHRPIAETLHRLLETTRGYASFALRPGSEQILANLDHLGHLARAYQRGGGMSFRGFVKLIEEKTSKDKTSSAPNLEEGINGVRLMTVHRAKGLEFPVVILADPSAKISFDRPARHVDSSKQLSAQRLLGLSPQELDLAEAEELVKERNEGLRLAYVAATRARDLLVVPTAGYGVDNLRFRGRRSWIYPLEDLVYPAKENYRGVPAHPQSPRVQNQTVLFRPDFLQEDSIEPGVHQSPLGEVEILWWDPATLNVQPKPLSGLAHEQFLSSQAPEQAEESLQNYQDWQNKREEALEGGQILSIDCATSESLDSSPESEFVVSLQQLAETPEELRGPRLGALVHRISYDLPLEAQPGQALALARLHGKVLGAPDAEQEWAAQAVEKLWQHPLVERARQAKNVKRNYPVMAETDFGQLLDGAIDLLFEEEEGFVAVDWKTGLLSINEQPQVDQMQWMLFALSQALGCEKLSGTILRI